MNSIRSAAVLLLIVSTAPAAIAAPPREPDVVACASLTVIANPPGGGTLTAATPRDCRDGYRIGTTVALTAVPASGFSFASWTSDAGGVRNVAAPQTTLVVSGSGAVAANFARQMRAPDAHFAVSPAAPRVGEPVTLSDTSSGFPTSWSWDVNDDGHLDALDRRPVVLFDSPGAHTVRLIAGNRAGSSSAVQTVIVGDAPGAFDAVDPNPDLIDPDGSITQDPSRVAADTTPVVGAAADGATRLVVRYAAPGPGQVAFALATGFSPANDGGFLSSGSKDPASSVTALVSAVNGGFLAFAVYLVPPDFNLPSGHETDHDRPLGLTAIFTPSGGSAAPPVPLALRLYRPPIVLLHGLWSNSSVWTMPLIGLPYLDVPTPFADYRDTNADRFSVNLLVPYTAVNAVLQWDRARGIAATRADFIAHSMGGILARQWVASAGYTSPTNFNAGDFHKLITLDSPHLGARSATYIVGIREETIVGRLFSAAMYAAGMPINDGAVDDLEFFSPAIDALGLAEVGSHALAGVGGSEYNGFCSGLTGDFVRIVAFFSRETVPELLTTIFGTEPNDVVVGLDSENGFLPAGATSTPIPGPDGAHFCVTSSGVYTDAIVALLNTPVASDAFQFFPPVITAHGMVRPPAPARAALPPPASGTTTSTVSIAPVVGGSAAVPGGLIHVSVTASSGVQRVLLLGAGDPIEIAGPPFETDVAIPADAAGPFTLTAVGDDGAGFAVSDPLVLTVVPAGAVASVAARPASMSLSAGGAPSPLEAIGAWDDGVSRRITALAGTEFVSSDATVAQVDVSGRVTPVSPGFATVTVRNGGASSDVPVAVLGPPAPACAPCPRVVPAR